ncbi:MAG: aspartate ammonia-lyase, partial [Chloroflexota bacterium]|nr:aspartate ammonia-lyase [Chloroflexota bacterium]
MRIEGQSWRIEHDSLGEVRVPAEALYGAQTQRAVENFPISGQRPYPTWIVATAVVKRAAAEVNMILGQLEPQIGQAIVQAAQEIVEGQWHDQFVVDPLQAGAGTSHNMNANEVIANRAAELLGEPRGTYRRVHPNDHVNMAQSTNDVIPTVIRISSLMALRKLTPILRDLESTMRSKAQEFDPIVKTGRTHLQDAVPVRLGQEFGAYAQAVAYDIARIERAAEDMKRVGIGGTATGTGLNSDPRYHSKMVNRLSELTGFDLRSSGNLFEATQSMADPAHLSAALRTLAVTLDRIANDLRLMSSGPNTGLAEIRLPAVQPGSSIMPGKVNPVMAEMLNMVCFQVMGNDLTIAFAAHAGQLELNVMMPILGHNLLHSLLILTNGVRAFNERCVKGIEADEEKCQAWVEGSMGIATALNPYIGYEAAAKVVQEA